MKKHFPYVLRALAMIFVALPLLLLSAQSGTGKTFTGEVIDSMCSPSRSHTAMIGKIPDMGSDSESCTKRCAAMGAKYKLYDQASNTVYSVENQDKLAQFAGRKVRVTGTLAGDTIKVEDVDNLS